MTLAEYQSAMNIALARTRIDMGEFPNMIICGNWCAIRYEITTKVSERMISCSVIEFVDFKDYGSELGVRAKEGWGGAKDFGFGGIEEDEKKVQQEQFSNLVDYVCDDLAKKYPVPYVMEDDSEFAKGIRHNWSKGNAGKVFAKDALFVLLNGRKLDFEGYPNSLESRIKEAKIEKNTSIPSLSAANGLHRKDREKNPLGRYGRQHVEFTTSLQSAIKTRLFLLKVH